MKTQSVGPIVNPKSEIRNAKSEAVLLAVTGMSPAVLTETVWALAHPTDACQPPIIPDRVIALTTTRGEREIGSQLFGPDAVWNALRREVLGLDSARDSRLFFGPDSDKCVKVFTGNDGGRPLKLDDIYTEADNTALADCITDELWALVEKPGTRIIASISGGYKTMSALLFAAMSLLGRKDDLITHVLVNAPYDTGLNPRFFYPEQPQQDLKDRDGKAWRARDAQLHLGLVPFVPLHDLLEKYKKPRSYSDLVERARGNLDCRLRHPVKLRLHVSRREVVLNDSVRFKLGTQPFLFLIFLAERARANDHSLGKYQEAMRPFQKFVVQLQRQWQHKKGAWMVGSRKLLPQGFERALAQLDDTPIRTKLVWGITQKLRRVPGSAMLEPYLPQPGRCTLDLPPASIEISD